MQSQVRFNRAPEKVPEKIPGSLGAKSSQVQQGYGEGSEGSGEGSEGSGEGAGKPWCKARSGSTGFRRRLQEALVQSQVRFNRVPEGSRNLGAKPSQVQQGSGEGSGEGLRFKQSQVRFNRVLEKVPEKVSGSLGAKPSQVQQGGSQAVWP